MKGIVFEVLNGTATILKNDGGFIEVPAKQGWQTGDLVTVQARRIKFPAIIAIAASVMLVFASLFTVLSVSNNQAALISMDINPSIEISVNRFGKVISTEARNDEGAALLDTVDVRGMPYAEAVLRLMENDSMGQYLIENGLLVFSVQADSAAWQEEVLATLRSSTDAYISSHHGSTTTEYFIVDGQLVAAAHQHGVTPGKYMLLLELESLDPGVDIEDYAHHSVGDIQAEIDAHHRHGNGGNGLGKGYGAPGATSSGSEQAASSSSQSEAAPVPSQAPTQTQPESAPQSGTGHEDEGHDNDGHGGGHNGGHD